MDVAVGATVAEPEVPFAANPAPLHDVALLEFHDRVEDCPAVIEFGLAASVSVGALGGGAPKAPVVHGVRLLLPQHVLKEDPEGAAGFEV